MSIKVLIVDDHAVVRQGLKVLLNTYSQITVVGEAADGETAIQLSQALKPDIILLDLIMPGLDGIWVIQKLNSLGSKIPVLVLTSSLENRLVKNALEAGAAGYILKAVRAGDLVKAIEDVVAGRTFLDSAIAGCLVEMTRQLDPLESLTGRERDVFDGVVRGKNNMEIASDLKIGEATVRTHFASIMEKLNLRDRTQATVYALKRGLVKLEELP